MSTKTVSLRETAYQKLSNLKREGESFSDVVERLAGSQKQELEKYSGSFPELAEVRDELEKERKNFELRNE